MAIVIKPEGLDSLPQTPYHKKPQRTYFFELPYENVHAQIRRSPQLEDASLLKLDVLKLYCRKIQ